MSVLTIKGTAPCDESEETILPESGACIKGDMSHPGTEETLLDEGKRPLALVVFWFLVVVFVWWFVWFWGCLCSFSPHHFLCFLPLQ